MDYIINNHETLRLNQIEQFPQVRLTYDDIHSQCSICINVFAKDETMLILPCVHKFHRFCIMPWLLEHSTCPTCRGNVLEDIDDRSTNGEDSDEDSEVEPSELSGMSTPDYRDYNELMNSYFDPSDDSLSDMSIEITGSLDYSCDVHIVTSSIFEMNADSDQSSEDSDEEIAAHTTFEMDEDSTDDDDGDVSVISVSVRSSYESGNESISYNSASSESAIEGNDSLDAMLPDSSDDDSLEMFSDDDTVMIIKWVHNSANGPIQKLSLNPRVFQNYFPISHP